MGPKIKLAMIIKIATPLSQLYDLSNFTLRLCMSFYYFL